MITFLHFYFLLYKIQAKDGSTTHSQRYPHTSKDLLLCRCDTGDTPQTFLAQKLTLAILEKVAFASALAAASRFVGAFGVADSANGEFSSLDVLADFLALDTEVGD